MRPGPTRSAGSQGNGSTDGRCLPASSAASSRWCWPQVATRRSTRSREPCATWHATPCCGATSSRAPKDPRPGDRRAPSLHHAAAADRQAGHSRYHGRRHAGHRGIVGVHRVPLREPRSRSVPRSIDLQSGSLARSPRVVRLRSAHVRRDARCPRGHPLDPRSPSRTCSTDPPDRTVRLRVVDRLDRISHGIERLELEFG